MIDLDAIEREARFRVGGWTHGLMPETVLALVAAVRAAQRALEAVAGRDVGASLLVPGGASLEEELRATLAPFEKGQA